MLSLKFDPRLSNRCAVYLRYSDKYRQNARSLEQQAVTIEEVRQRAGYPWRVVAEFRDAHSGRKLHKRLEFMKMLRQIENGTLKIDLIVVDSLERFGRADQIREIRWKLATQYGILIVAADNGFADPTGPTGAAIAAMEQMRSTEHSRISAHNVNRGKKDAARRRRWTGGPAPFGFRLDPQLDTSVSPARSFSLLVPEPEQAAALDLAVRRADQTGDGDSRMAKWWNENPEIPEKFKPISPFTMGYRLRNRIAVGDLVYGVNQTDVVDDTRVVKRNPDGPLVIPDFCEAIVDREAFERIQQTRAARKRKKRDAGSADNKLIEPLNPGITLKRPLAGLVRCRHCGSSMCPVTSGRKSKSGVEYVYYACPRRVGGGCVNGRHVSEPALRAAVFAELKQRFGPADPEKDLAEWFGRVVQGLESEFVRIRNLGPEKTAERLRQVADLEEQIRGWSQTLAKPQLAAVLRQDIEQRYEAALALQQELQRQEAEDEAAERQLRKALDLDSVRGAMVEFVENLDRLNPTLQNLELSKHVEAIWCDAADAIELRGVDLGFFEGAMDFLARTQNVASGPAVASDSKYSPVVPRVRGRLNVPNLTAEPGLLGLADDTCLDPRRFAGLPEQFFWTQSIELAPKVWPGEAKADQIVHLRLKRLTHPEIAEKVELSIPTVRKMIRQAEATNPALASLPRKMPCARWHEDHAAEVAEAAKTMKPGELVRHFGRSDPTIKKALAFFALQSKASTEAEPPVQDSGQPRPDPA
jgi:DNA invertase Pin-like site-specific DNA recombinase